MGWGGGGGGVGVGGGGGAGNTGGGGEGDTGGGALSVLHLIPKRSARLARLDETLPAGTEIDLLGAALRLSTPSFGAGEQKPNLNPLKVPCAPK